MAWRVTNLFIEMASIGGVFKAFNVVGFAKRNGGGSTGYWRGRGRLKQHLISLRREAVKGRGVAARGRRRWCAWEAVTAWLEVGDEAGGGLGHYGLLSLNRLDGCWASTCEHMPELG
jgi:hypothetical protein